MNIERWAIHILRKPVFQAHVAKHLASAEFFICNVSIKINCLCQGLKYNPLAKQKLHPDFSVRSPANPFSACCISLRTATEAESHMINQATLRKHRYFPKSNVGCVPAHQRWKTLHRKFWPWTQAAISNPNKIWLEGASGSWTHDGFLRGQRSKIGSFCFQFRCLSLRLETAQLFPILRKFSVDHLPQEGNFQ